MKIRARPVFPQHRLIAGECDIWALRLRGQVLELEIHRNFLGTDGALRISFPGYRSFFVTDEGDLPAYWSSGQFKKEDGHVFEMLNGGLISQESERPGTLVVTATLPNSREWFVSTSGQCAIIISETEPQIECVPRHREP